MIDTHVETIETSDAASVVRSAIDHAAHYLPTQGPISVFVHHNTLHAFEDLPFEEAVEAGYHKYGYQPYWPESRYREEYKRGRILDKDIESVLIEDLRQHGLEEVAEGTTRYELRESLMKSHVLEGNDFELRWLTAQTDALDRFCESATYSIQTQVIESMRHWVMRELRNESETTTSENARSVKILNRLKPFFNFSRLEDWSDATWRKWTLHFLWNQCLEAGEVTESRRIVKQPILRHRDRLFAEVSVDSDTLVHELLVRFSAAMLDQGVATWPIPNRDDGFYQCFLSLFKDQVPWAERWMIPLSRWIKDEELESLTPIESIVRSLEILEIPRSDWPNYIERSLLSLPGWTGMVQQMSTNASWTLYPAKAGSLDEFLAIRLILDRLAVRFVADTNLPERGLRFGQILNYGDREIVKSPLASSHQRAFHLFQTSQRLGWNSQIISRWGNAQWQTVIDELEHFDGLSRRRIFHLAFERNYRVKVLDAMSEHSRGPLQRPSKINLQVITCIDDREESFRRQLEEIDPSIETFGAPGFFAVPMFFSRCCRRTLHTALPSYRYS